MQVLAIDIGGTNVKLLRTGDSERRKFPSGPNLTPKRFAKGIKAATQGWSYDAVTVGLPAPIADGRPFWPMTPSCRLWARGPVKEKCCISVWGQVWGMPWCFLTKLAFPWWSPWNLVICLTEMERRLSSVWGSPP